MNKLSSAAMLIKNENMKIYRRPRTWAMIGLLIIALMLVAGIMKWDQSSQSDQSNWREEITQGNESMRQALTENEGAFDEQTAINLENRIKVNEYYLDNNINPYAYTLWSYMDTSSALIILVTILTVIVAADMVAAEFSWGTIKLLLVGPASRAKVLLCKYISTFMFAILLLVLCFAVSFAIGASLEGLDSLSQPKISIGADGQIEESSMVLNVLQKYGYSVIELIMYVTFAFMISASFRSSSMAIGFSLLGILMGNTLVSVLAKYEWVKYLLFANIDLSRYANGHPLRPEMTLSFSIIMLAVYYIVFQLIAWFMFTKRDVAG
ncbi:ABC transporter permease [Paenibacillus sp. IITD108]|uniref:ABC transporter permease n=1 Tax=Paenibacillus sp. IITD108 TaxID=3116649 RepID=UPI002F411704